jgi:hypothetical protein
VAGVVDTREGVMKILINGVEVASGAFSRKEIWRSELPLRIGWTHEADPLYAPFAGQIDEVRIWKVARTATQIGRGMFTPLRGDEPGLVGYWRFEGEGETATDATRNGGDGRFIGNAARLRSELPAHVRQPVALSGVVHNEAGAPMNMVNVRLQSQSDIVAEAQTDARGRYHLATLTEGTYDFYATLKTQGALREGIRLRAGEHRRLNFTLKEANRIEGMLLMLDESTPHVAAVVQAVIPSLDGQSEPHVVATRLSGENGKYQFVNLKPGRYQIRCYTLDGYIYYRDGTLIQVEHGKSLKNIDFRFAPFKKGTWRSHSDFGGLRNNVINAIYRAPDGAMWFGTGMNQLRAAGVIRYEGNVFTSFTEKDGLASNSVYAIYGTPDGVIWFGTGGGVSRYDGKQSRRGRDSKQFVNFTQADGLASSLVAAIHRDPDGVLWFGTWGGGVSQYDGKEFVNFTTEDGLADNRVRAIHQNPDGTMWFGTYRGVCVYDGERFIKTLTVKDGLVHDRVRAIHQNPDGTMWFGTWGGVSRYDGKTFVNFTQQDGLLHNEVNAIYRNPDGVLWFGTGPWIGQGGGLSRYDGNGFVNFTPKDGLANNTVWTIQRTPDGALWFGTGDWSGGGGVSVYDEKGFVNFTPTRRANGTRDCRHRACSRWHDVVYDLWRRGLSVRREEVPKGSGFRTICQLHHRRWVGE